MDTSLIKLLDFSEEKNEYQLLSCQAIFKPVSCVYTKSVYSSSKLTVFFKRCQKSFWSSILPSSTLTVGSSGLTQGPTGISRHLLCIVSFIGSVLHFRVRLFRTCTPAVPISQHCAALGSHVFNLFEPQCRQQYNGFKFNNLH